MRSPERVHGTRSSPTASEADTWSVRRSAASRQGYRTHHRARLVITDRAPCRTALGDYASLGSARQVFIRLGSHVMMPGKIMQMMRPNIISNTNGIDDL
jgi:hypothetical protein